MNITFDQIAPDLLQTLAYQADARGLSANEYLRHLLGLSNGASAPSALADVPEEAPPRNEEMLAIIRETHEWLKDMPVRGSTEETLKMIRRARDGEMWGYEPTDPPNVKTMGALVIDANVLVAICAKEPTAQIAEDALNNYAARNWVFYAAGAILTEGLFILCNKLKDGSLTEAEHASAIKTFNRYMQGIRPSPQGDIRFILRNEEIRRGYSCLHSADAYYVALTEELVRSGPAEFLTFDKRLVNVTAKNAPTVKVNLLLS